LIFLLFFIALTYEKQPAINRTCYRPYEQELHWGEKLGVEPASVKGRTENIKTAMAV
jgi:hypothetical protein